MGIYRTFVMLLAGGDPTRIVRLMERPFLESKPDLKARIAGRIFLPDGVVFTTGLVQYENRYLVLSGELDTAVRMTVADTDVLNDFLE